MNKIIEKLNKVFSKTADEAACSAAMRLVDAESTLEKEYDEYIEGGKFVQERHDALAALRTNCKTCESECLTIIADFDAEQEKIAYRELCDNYGKVSAMDRAAQKTMKIGRGQRDDSGDGYRR